MEKDQVAKNFTVVVIGGSAGSLDVLMKVIPQIKETPNYAMIVVLHRKSTEDTLLEDLFSARAAIPVKTVEDKTPIRPGNIYVAPSDYHLLLEKNDSLSLDISEKVNYSRPSIDVTFESAAEAYGGRVVGILLSGANADGTEGLIAIKAAGGITIVQDPESAEMPYMPQNAINNLTASRVVKPAELLELLIGGTF